MLIVLLVFFAMICSRTMMMTATLKIRNQVAYFNFSDFLLQEIWSNS